MEAKLTTIVQMKVVLGQIKNLIARVAQAVDGDVERVETALSGHTGNKSNPHGVTAAQVGAAQKPLSGSTTIPATGWGSDSTAGYSQYYDLSVSGVTASDRAEITLAAASLSTAASCGFCPTCETLAGKIRLRAASIPVEALNVCYWIEKGV